MLITEPLQRTLTLISRAAGDGDAARPSAPNPRSPSRRPTASSTSRSATASLGAAAPLTQYRSRSLEDHLRLGWNFLPRRLAQFISPLPPQRATKESWYLGTADAVTQNLDTIEAERKQRVLILSGDHIYKMDYGRMLEDHIRNRADVTVGVIPVPGRGGAPLRRDRDHRRRARRRLRREAGRPQADARPRRPGARVDGHLPVRVEGARRAAARGRGARRFDARLRQGRDPERDPVASRLRAPVHRRERGRRQRLRQGALLARHRDDRVVLRGEPRPLPRRAAVQPLRPALADLHAAAQRAAGQDRVRRRAPQPRERAPRRGARLDRLPRRDRVGRTRRALRPLVPRPGRGARGRRGLDPARRRRDREGRPRPARDHRQVDGRPARRASAKRGARPRAFTVCRAGSAWCRCTRSAANAKNDQGPPPPGGPVRRHGSSPVLSGVRSRVLPVPRFESRRPLPATHPLATRVPRCPIEQHVCPTGKPERPTRFKDTACVECTDCRSSASSFEVETSRPKSPPRGRFAPISPIRAGAFRPARPLRGRRAPCRTRSACGRACAG